MSADKTIVLVVGASGTIGRLAVEDAIRRGYETKALVRDPNQTKLFPVGTSRCWRPDPCRNLA
jgi:putative NADH-flavin reductase